MTKPKTLQNRQIVRFHILLSVTPGGMGPMLGGTIAALRNGVSHVTEACGMGIAGCGSSQHWIMWSVAVAVLFYAGLINGLIVETTYRPAATSAGYSELASLLADGVRWVRSELSASQASSRFKQWVALNLLLGVVGTIASAAMGGAVGGFLYGNFITGMGAAHGVPGIGWFFGSTFGVAVATVSAALFGSIAGAVSVVMLRRPPRLHRRP